MSGFSISTLTAEQPVLIAGPTASGKSALALRIAQEQGGVVVNADALQVYQGWPILSAQPPAVDLAAAPHRLYGHLPYDARYSVGDWLRDLEPLLAGRRPIIVGGTGLYFTALTQGLAQIPPTPAQVRTQADTVPLEHMIAALDAQTRARLDLQNRARVQRAYEVLRATGRSLASWQDAPAQPLLPIEKCQPLVLEAPKEWLTPRIALRFDLMLQAGALEEARAMQPRWDPGLLSSKAIGARELIAHLDGEMAIDSAREAVIIATRQYAKRQRTWFRARMSGWRWLAPQDLAH